jgi:hypothetical protein
MERQTDDSTARALQKEIDELVQEQYSTQWSTSINVDASVFGQPLAAVNVCDFLGVGTLWSGVIVRFCCESYPPDKSGMSKLRVFLENAARQSGLNIVCRTSSERVIGAGKECMSLICALTMTKKTRRVEMKQRTETRQARRVRQARRSMTADTKELFSTMLEKPTAKMGRLVLVEETRSEELTLLSRAVRFSKNRRISTQKNADETKTVSERLLRGFMR